MRAIGFDLLRDGADGGSLRMKQKVIRFGPRIITIGILGVLGILYGCGGNAGVGNGTIVGRVFSDSSSASFAKTPVGGVTVVARRLTGNPLIVRRALTDSNGQFVFPDIFTGPYSLGFSKEGFIPIDPINGGTTTRTNVGAEDVFVESDSTSVIPDVVLATNLQSGSATAIITVLDGVTGDPVSNATVSVGVGVSSNGGTNGVYVMTVPLQPFDDSANQPNSDRQLSIQAEGYNAFNDAVGVGLVANETVERTIFLSPLTVEFEGVVRLSSFFKADEIIDITQVNITVENAISGQIQNIASSRPNGEGEFRVPGVPASNSQITRTFNLRFTHPNLQTAVVSNVVAPRAGVRTVPLVVTMNFITVDVIGLVADNLGGFPPTGTAVCVETGQQASVVNGTFTIPGVPVQQAPGDAAFTFNVCAFNLAGVPGSVSFIARPVSDGSPNPVFALGLGVLAVGACN